MLYLIPYSAIVLRPPRRTRPDACHRGPAVGSAGPGNRSEEETPRGRRSDRRLSILWPRCRVRNSKAGALGVYLSQRRKFAINNVRWLVVASFGLLAISFMILGLAVGRKLQTASPDLSPAPAPVVAPALEDPIAAVG